MRSRLLVIILLIIFALCCQHAAQHSELKVQSTTPSPNAAAERPLGVPSPPVINQPYYGTGVIKIINLKEGWIEIDHEEIKGLMPAMEMEFWVKNVSLLHSVSVGDRVDFTVIETGKGEYITGLKKVAATP
jgi:Cu/Ag efflux protein CusF